MSARKWKPGDVAMVRLATRSTAEVGIYDGDVWTVRKGVTSEPIQEPRPVIVIDPEDREQVEAICWARWTSHDPLDVEKMQAALRSLITPPKPEEPLGLGAVVEDAEGLRWLRHSGILAPWHRSDAAPSERAWRYWDDIAAVKILSEGVQ